METRNSEINNLENEKVEAVETEEKENEALGLEIDSWQKRRSGSFRTRLRN